MPPVLNNGGSIDTLGPRQPDTDHSTSQTITVNNPDKDTVTWSFSSLGLPSNKSFVFATHTYGDTTKLNFKINDNTPVVPLSNASPLQIVSSSQQGITKIVLDFSNVPKGTTVKVGDFFVGHQDA